jgi:hypothetical protein
VSDLRRQLATAKNERDQLRAENQALRHIIGDIPPEYATALAALCDLAYHGCRRPDDLGGTITASHASSRPPNHNPIAYHHRNEERRHLRARSVRVWTTVERLVDGPTVVGHHTSAQTA